MIEPPPELRAALDNALAPYPPRTLAEAADALSAAYRRATTSGSRQPARGQARPTSDVVDDAIETSSAPPAQPMTALAVAAYAATRLPATFAAIAAALTQARLRRPDWRPQSLLDAGAGTGAALWAARAVWPDLAHATLLERDPQMIALGRRLAAATPATGSVAWRQGDLHDGLLWGDDADAATNTLRRNKPDRESVSVAGGYDLVTAAYVLSELRADERTALVARLWGATSAATNGALALVAPGTPIGFAHIRAARAQLIAAGATILAPCPHDEECPMGAAGPLAASGATHNGTAGPQRNVASQPGYAIAPTDWCHFAQRLARSRLHRQIKGGDLAYEDEKFSYVIAVRPSNPAVVAGAPIGGRIVRHPQTRAGLVALEVCAPGGLERRVITRKDRDAYRQARDLRWGDALPSPNLVS